MHLFHQMLPEASIDYGLFRSGFYRVQIMQGDLLHLAPYVIKQAETVIVLRKNPYELEKIYSQRNYSKEKTLENIQAEILGIIAYDALQTFPDLIQIDTTNHSPKEVISLIENRSDHTIDWLQLVSEKGDLEKFFPNESS